LIIESLHLIKRAFPQFFLLGSFFLSIANANENFGRLGAPLNPKFYPDGNGGAELIDPVYEVVDVSAKPFKLESHMLEINNIGTLMLTKKWFRGSNNDEFVRAIIKVEKGKYITSPMAAEIANKIKPRLRHKNIEVEIISECQKKWCVKRECYIASFDSDGDKIIPSCSENYEIEKLQAVENFGEINILIRYSLDEDDLSSGIDEIERYATASITLNNKNLITRETTKTLQESLSSTLDKYFVLDGLVTVKDNSVGCNFWRKKLNGNLVEIDCWRDDVEVQKVE